MGGSGGGTSTTMQQFKPPDWVQPYMEQFLGNAANIAQQPQQQYNGMTVAPLNSIQDTGLKMAVDRGVNGASDLNAARGSMMGMVNGNYMNQAPGATSNVQGAANPYGDNSYVDSVINQNAANMSRAFATGTAAQNDAMANMQGAYGGTAWQQKQQQDAAGLANQIGQMANTARMDNLNQMRTVGAQDADRSLGAQQFNQTQKQGAFDNGLQAMLGASGQINNLAQDDYRGIQAVTGAGDAYNADTQKVLDAAKTQFDQQQQYPIAMSDYFRNALMSMSGQGGSNTSSTSQNGGFSLPGALAGLGGIGYAATQYLPRVS